MSTQVVIPYNGLADLLIEGQDERYQVKVLIEAKGETHEVQATGGTFATPPVWSWRLYVKEDWSDNKWLNLVGKDVRVRVPDGRTGQLKLIDSADRFLTGYGRGMPFDLPNESTGG